MMTYIHWRVMVKTRGVEGWRSAILQEPGRGRVTGTEAGPARPPKLEL